MAGEGVSLEYNGDHFQVPCSLLEDEQVFNQVISRDTWDHTLNNEDRKELMKLLPKGLTPNEQEDTITNLLDGKIEQFGNPVKDVWNKLNMGAWSSNIDPLRKELEQLQYQLYKQHMKFYHMNLLQDILLSKRQLINSALDNGSLDNLEPLETTPTKTTPHNRSKRKGVWKKSETKYKKLLKECNEEGGVEISGSDDETTPTKGPHPQVMSEVEYQKMLKRHKKRRRTKKMDPDLNTRGITMSSIGDVHTGSTPNSIPSMIINKSEPLLSAVDTPPTPKAPPTKMIHQPVVKDSRQWEGLFHGPGCIYEVYDDAEKLKGDGSSPIILDAPLPTGQYSSFFSLMKNCFNSLIDHKGDLSKVTEMVQLFLDSPEGISCSWLSKRSDWLELTLSALCYLGGEVGSVSSFDPLPHFFPVLEFKDRIDHWKWQGNNRDSDIELLVLCNHWLANIDRTLIVVDYTDYAPPSPLISTSSLVKPSKSYEMERFRQLELERYSRPHKAFVYNVHGYEATVGPVKGAKTVMKKEHSSRARGHALLKQERPNCVTILSLVRDACSRLPNGEGTRLDLCILLRDSQFVSDNVTDGQLNNAVSGALDRLHYEKDPCVRYISSKKLWLYLHRNRAEEEFEHISWAIEAANKNKKIIHTRAKHIPKILLRESSGQLTDISPSPRDLVKKTTPSSIKSLHRSPRGGGAGSEGGVRATRGRGGGRGKGKGKDSGVKRGTTKQLVTNPLESDNDDSMELPFLPTTSSKKYDFQHINSDSNSSDDSSNNLSGLTKVSFQPPPPVPRLMSDYEFQPTRAGGPVKNPAWMGGDSSNSSDESD